MNPKIPPMPIPKPPPAKKAMLGSRNDTKNHTDFAKKYGDFLSIILNPQKEKIVCFAGKDCEQTNLILLSK